MFKLIWNPTGSLMSMARHSFAILLPIIFVLIFILGISSSTFFALVFLLLVVRGIIIIRGSYTLPYSEFDSLSFQLRGKESSIGILILRGLSLIFPITAVYLLISLPGFSYIFFSGIMLVGLLFLPRAKVSSLLFLLMFLLCNVSSLIISGMKAGISGIYVCVLLIMIVSVESFANHVSLKIKSATNNGMQADAAEPRG